MASTPATSALYGDLLKAARNGDQHAFGRLVEPHRRELHAHCCRMLGWLHDTEDSLQDALLRAWRGLPGFDGRSSPSGAARGTPYRAPTCPSPSTC